MTWPASTGAFSDKVLARFKSKVDARGPGACWYWLDAHTGRGFGAFRVGDRSIIPARFSYRAFVGEIPAGFVLVRSCTDRACVNPAHLSLSRNARTHLTERDVREIRAGAHAGATQDALADRFGVTQSAISRIVSGETWGHLATRGVA